MKFKGEIPEVAYTLEEPGSDTPTLRELEQKVMNWQRGLGADLRNRREEIMGGASMTTDGISAVDVVASAPALGADEEAMLARQLRIPTGVYRVDESGRSHTLALEDPSTLMSAELRARFFSLS